LEMRSSVTSGVFVRSGRRCGRRRAGPIAQR
jgi:hypothetical protein